MLTSFTSDGEVAARLQGEILRGLASPLAPAHPCAEEITKAVIQVLAIQSQKINCDSM